MSLLKHTEMDHLILFYKPQRIIFLNTIYKRKGYHLSIVLGLFQHLRFR